MDIETMPAEWHLAAALHLLSATALCGVSQAKTAAMLAHLERIGANADVDPVLRETVTELIQAWATASCSCADGSVHEARLLH